MNFFAGMLLGLIIGWLSMAKIMTDNAEKLKQKLRDLGQTVI